MMQSEQRYLSHFLHFRRYCVLELRLLHFGAESHPSQQHHYRNGRADFMAGHLFPDSKFQPI
jgi:hypothetical protein